MSFASRLLVPRRTGLTSAAAIVSGQDGRTPSRSLLPNTQAWQDEVWGFYDTLGMYRNAVTWKADMLGRVRLRAAKKELGNDEPTIVDKGPAAEIVDELAQDIQSQIMSGLAVYLTVPGEGYVVGETVDGVNNWIARSSDEVRYRPGAKSRQGIVSPYEVIDENAPSNTNIWRRLEPESFVVRVWRPHRRYYNLSDSSSRPARNTMRELELVNRAIVAHYMSRLAMAGVIIFPTEVDFPVRPEFRDMPNAFIREWVEQAAEALKTPGSPASLVPIPIRMDAAYIDKVRFVEFTTKYDIQIIAKRDSAIKQLAVDLDTPPETLTGMADANHWTGWLIEESGFKIYLAPDTELIVGALTKGYLRPRLKANNEDTDWVVWYDESEITQRPDKSEDTFAAYKLGAVNGKALRREAGLDQSDEPKAEELARMALWTLANNPQTAAQALKDLTGVMLGGSLTAGERETITPSLPGQTVDMPTDSPAASGEGEHTGPPAQPKGPSESQPALPASAAVIDVEAQLAAQGRLPHAIKVTMFGHQVLHPPECRDHLQSCPVTHATWGDRLRHRPGTPGHYALALTPEQVPMIGVRLYDADVVGMLPTASQLAAVP
jgi:hypothetical protein